MHHGAVTAGVLTGELVAVQAVSDGLADLLRVGGEHAAVELQLAVAVAHVRNLVGSALFHQVQAGVDGVAAAGAVQHVHSAGFQLVHHGVGRHGLDDQSLDGGLYAAVVTHELGVGLQGSLLAGLIEAVEQVGATGDLGIVPVAGLGVVDGLLQQVSGEVAGNLGAVLGIHHIAVGGNHSQGPGPQGGVGDVIVVGKLLGLHGEGVGHVVHQMDTGKGVGGAGQPLIVTHVGIAAVAGIRTVHLLHLVAVLQQNGEDVVLGGDGGAIAPNQAVVDADGVGLGAVLVLSLLVGGHHGGVVLKLTLFGIHHGVIAAVDQVIHVVVGLRGGEPSIVKLVDDLGDGADDQLAGRLSGLFAGLASFGIRARGALRLRGAHL